MLGIQPDIRDEYVTDTNAEVEDVAQVQRAPASEQEPVSEPTVDLGSTQITPVEKSYEEQLLDQLKGLRESSKEEVAAARESDRKKGMYANLAKALGSIGAADIQRKAGVRAGLQPFQAVSGPNTAKDVMADKRADVQALLDEYRIRKSAEPKDFKNIYKVGDELVRVGKDGAAEKLYGEKKKEKVTPTEGEKTVDREFAKEYNKWATGGKSDYEVNSKIFKDAISKLKTGKVSTGTLSGLGARIPGYRSETREVEDQVRKAINGMLRATLGAQFTEKEGERIFQQTFDPAKSEKANVRAMELELAKLEKRKNDIEDMGKYYTKNKTISGYEIPEAKSGIDSEAMANEIKRKTKDGRIAIFDADTKEFIRYE